MLRKFQQQRLQKLREASFNLTQRVNDILLPSYDALRDPYLTGYFDNPILKRHLKQTGVINRKRKLSVRLDRGSPEDKTHGALTQRMRGQRSKSLAKSNKHSKNQVRLPALEELLEEQRRVMGSSSSNFPKQIYKSSNHFHQF